MNILMMTNTFTPHVGGVARSVSTFSDELRAMGHKVLVVAPEYEEMPEKEENVIRLPALQNFNGSDFSVSIPIPGHLANYLDKFQPQIVHSHHPFLIGSAAVRISMKYRIPLVFTYHTMYERYTHYVPVDFKALKDFVIKLSVGYANMCELVISPTESISQILRKRNISSPIEIIPTGIRTDDFKTGDPQNFRNKCKIPEDSFVIGCVSRLAPEKNFSFLSECALEFVKNTENSYFLVVGDGPAKKDIENLFLKNSLQSRLLLPGKIQKESIVNAYKAMDLFVFASKTETQGIVLQEAMASSVPVIGLDATGTRDTIEDGANGFLVSSENIADFSKKILDYYKLPAETKNKMQKSALKTAEKYSTRSCAEKLVDNYRKIIASENITEKRDTGNWEKAKSQIKAEWEIIRNIASAASSSISKKNKNLDDVTS